MRGTNLRASRIAWPLTLALLACLCVGCPSAKGLRRVEIRVAGHSLTAEVADTPEAHKRGLMFRKSLGKNEGMLFVYDKPQVLYFYMKNTSIPLSIAFIDENGVIIRIADMRPFDHNGPNSVLDALYALEVNLGWFDKKGIEAGAKVEIPQEARAGQR